MLWQACHKVVSADYYPFYHCSKKAIQKDSSLALDDMDFIHNNASDALFGQKHSLVRNLAKFFLVLTWPLRLLKLTIKLIRRHGQYITSVTGKSKLTQAIELLNFALFHNIPPTAYCLYQLYLPEQKSRSSSYIHNHEVSPLFSRLNYRKQNEGITNKKVFSLICEQNQLPAAKTLGEFNGGRFTGLNDEILAQGDIERLFEREIFIKPSIGFRGQEAMHWRKNGEGLLENDRNLTFTTKELIKYYLQKSKKRPFVLQERLRSHPSLLNLSGKSICTLRIITIRDKNGLISHLLSALKLPYLNEVTNNVGYFCAIHDKSGELGRLFSYKTLCTGFDRHPELDVNIQGKLIPDWPQAMALALRAHRCFPEYFSLGWDIALASSGPTLLEGNCGWDVLTIQRAHQKALGETSFKPHCVSRLTELTK